MQCVARRTARGGEASDTASGPSVRQRDLLHLRAEHVTHRRIWKKYICRQCKNKIPIVAWKSVLQEQLKQFFLSPSDLAAYLEQSDDVIKTKKELLDSLEAERGRLRQDMDKVYRLYMANGISVDGFRQTYGPLEERAKQVDAELPRLQAEVDYLKIQHLSRDEVLMESRGSLFQVDRT